ncbi:hypothetical protein OX284_002360 [Flavobacterium sp. SUN046]|uniref:hypothetical protein n=1 Tax=Flavobacterium sp. SUN046 TaxID=3002440 RepID=UPI002DB74BBC|nr:hypothetical protein [Flavobacterium sp. SUN046]MEC4048259.1 hypothetical protein [Flavobacterium sp. SUN046]
MKTFIEDNDFLFGVQLSNFHEKLEVNAELLGFTEDEINEAKADSEYWDYSVKSCDKMESTTKDFFGSKNLLRNGSKRGEVFNGMPSPLALGTPPAIVPANIQLRFTQKAAKAKANPNYTKAIGKDLGIESPEQVFVPSHGKPSLKIKLNAGHPEIRFVKGHFEGLEIHKDTGSGFKLLATSFRAGYNDTSGLPPAGVSEIWKYKGIYFHGNLQVGQWSDEVSVTVTGV